MRNTNYIKDIETENKGNFTMMTFIADYATRNNAMRRASQLNIEDPVLKVNDEGRVELFRKEKQNKQQTSVEKSSTKEHPVKVFRRIFAENFGVKSWSEIISIAAAAGVNKNTAKTYYYKLKVKADEEQVEQEVA